MDSCHPSPYARRLRKGIQLPDMRIQPIGSQMSIEISMNAKLFSYAMRRNLVNYLQACYSHTISLDKVSQSC